MKSHRLCPDNDLTFLSSNNKKTKISNLQNDISFVYLERLHKNSYHSERFQFKEYQANINFYIMFYRFYHLRWTKVACIHFITSTRGLYSVKCAQLKHLGTLFRFVCRNSEVVEETASFRHTDFASSVNYFVLYNR